MSFRHLAICLLLVVLPLSRTGLAADELPAWTPIGPNGGDVQALAVSPARPNLVVAGLQRSGIFQSTDRSGRWRAATGTFGRNVLDVAIDAQGKAFYAATYEGFLKSTDGGSRWTVLEGPTAPTYMLVATHPSKPAVVFAVRGGELWRSTNGGVTRTPVAGPVWVTRIAFAATGRRTVMYAGAVNGLWKSGDDGRTWTAVSLPFPSPPEVDAVAVDPIDPRILYIGLHAQNVLLKSLDGGASWRLSQRGLPAAQPGVLRTVSELAVDRTNPATVYAVMDGEIFRSVNRGRDWSRSVPRIPGSSVSSVNDLETTGYGVLAATSAGVLLSTDRGLTWQHRTAGMSATWIAGMDIDHQEPARLYASTVLAGLFKTADQGRSWLRLGAAALPSNSNQPLAVDPDDPNVVHTIADAAFAKSTNGGRRWTLREWNPCVDFARIALDPREPDHVFASGQTGCPYPDVCTFFRSQTAGEAWACLGFGNLISMLGIDPFTSAVYARAPSGGFLRSTDDGATWTHLHDRLSALSFAASPLVEGTLWAGQARAVARSRDGGQTWQAFSAGLRAAESVVGLAPDPVDPATLYAATQQSGVFKSTDAGETWSPAGRWPAGVLYQAGLLVDPGDPAIVYAGTSSLGVLRLDQGGELRE